MTDLQKIKRGEEAERIFKSGLMQEYFEERKKAFLQAMGNSPMGDEKTHNRLVIALQVLLQLEKSFKQDIDTGKIAQINLSGGVVQRLQGIA